MTSDGVRRDHFRRTPGALTTGLRFAALGFLFLLILNPPVPGNDPNSGTGSSELVFVVIDADPSLHAEGAWGSMQAALDALDPPDDWILIRVAGGVVEPMTPEGLTPGQGTASVEAALSGLVEAGADALVLLSPLRGVDPSGEGLRRALGRVPFRIVPVETEIRNAGVEAIELSSPPRSNQAVQGHIVVAGEGHAPVAVGADPTGTARGAEAAVTAEVTLTRIAGAGEVSGAGDAEGIQVGQWQISLPEAGARMRIPFELAPTQWDAPFTLVASVRLAGDAYLWDDELRLDVDPGWSLGGILLLSLTPDAEPRLLLPALEQGTGLVGAGWLRVGSDRFLGLRRDDRDVPIRGEAALAAEIPGAALVVLHGAQGAPFPEGWTEALDLHPAVLHLPATPEGVRWAGLTASRRATAGTQGATVSEPLPPSPVRAGLAGAIHGGLPPLSAPIWLDGGDATSLFDVQVSPSGAGGGRTAPALVLRNQVNSPSLEPPTQGSTPDRAPWEQRVAVVLSSGTWTWAAAGEMRAYGALWSGVAGWLLAPGSEQGGGATSRAPVSTGERLDREPLRNAVLRPSVDGPDFMPMERVLPGVSWQELGLEGVGGASSQAARRPLRSHPLPWFLLLGLLSVEWVLRARPRTRSTP